MLFCPLFFETFFFQFFTHPVVHSEMTRKWRGRVLMAINIGKWTWFFLHIWCLFEMVLAPITFYCVSYFTDTSVSRGKQSTYRYQAYFYFISMCVLLFKIILGGSEFPSDNPFVFSLLALKNIYM